MNNLSDERIKILYKELYYYLGVNAISLISGPNDGYCFSEHKDRVYYVRRRILDKSDYFDDNQLVSAGTCFGKFSKKNNLKLHISSLPHLAPYAECKVWVKPSFEQEYLNGKNIPKSGLGRITENARKFDGVLVFSMNDLPLGFGVMACSIDDCKSADPMTTVCFHLSDIGEYERDKDTLF